MKNYIVKVREYDDSGLLSYGTGIVIGDGTAILTAAHVICGSKHCVILASEKGEAEIETQLLQKNKVAAVLSVNSSLHCESANIFSNQEIFDDDISWSAEGYITDEQFAHEIMGKGIVRSKYHDGVWDCELGGITSGNSQNYRGMSGTPVISCNRIVGILQIQTPFERGVLGLKMASVEMFQDILPQDSLVPNEYETLLFERSQHESILRVKQNKESGKYIPNIFVEENDCKENLRYFADPLLFLKKAVRDCRNIDFSRQNVQLGAFQKKLIDVSTLAEPDSLDDVSATQQTVLEFLKYAKESLGFLSNDTHSREIPSEDYWSQWSRNYNSVPFFAGDLLKNVEAAGASFALLTKRAGQGKTNLLCDFTENFLLKKKYCVWYYNAYELRESPMEYLKREWSIDGRYSLFYPYGGLKMLSYLLAALESEEDKRRFIELYEENHVRAEQTALRILKNPHDAEDAVQNAFLQVIHHFDKILEIPCKKLGFWIISIVKNEALMILRRKQKELLQEDWDTFSADVSDPIGYNELVQLFSQLSPTYRAVLEMRMINDYSGKEIAVHLGISESAVNTRISRGRILLRELAVKEGFHV